MCDREVYK
jgi:hypothetical protein